MKVRKLAVALALAGGLGSGVAQALGLGEIELQSYLNEPLDAEIVLPQSRGINPADVFVNIASEEAYNLVGLDRNQFLSKLRFQVIPGSDGRLVINVSSREPLREPYLNFLLELTWPNGRLLREYAVLVDPPVYAEESGVQEQVSAPRVTSTPQAVQQPSSARSAESLRRQTQAERSLGTGYQADTFGPTGASDTLWSIASSVRPDSSVSTQQVMLAIQDLNPDAFIDNNINRLKRGEILRIPSMDQIRSRSRAEATAMVAQQNRAFRSPQRPVDATASEAQQGVAQAPAAAGGDELKLIVAESGSRDASDGGSAGGDGELPGGVDAGTAVAMEQLESARRENAELNSRVDDLEDQVQTLQRLLELKNTQLAEMQQAFGADEAAGQAGAVESSESGATSGDAAVTGEQAEAGESMAATYEPGTAEPEATADGQQTPASEASAETAEAPEMQGPQNASDTSATGADQPVAIDTDAMADGEPGDLEQAPEKAEPAPAPAQAEEPAPSPQQPAADKGFPGNIIDAITSNPMYQIALGGGLIVLLLLLLLLARRNANREKAFYEQLNSETDEGGDSFDLSFDDDEQESGEGDALAEADAYVAYGRHDQAAQTLETAISREPSRTDLRLKLLGVYAELQDRDSFEKQFGEIEALDDEDALASANELRARLEEAEAMPSIDDLESQLRSDSFGKENAETAEDDAPASDELLADQFDAGEEQPEENEFGDFDPDLSDVDLSEYEEQELQESEGQKESDESGAIEYDLSGIELDTGDDEPAADDKTGVADAGDWDLSSEFEDDLSESEPLSEPGEDSDDFEQELSLDLDEHESAVGKSESTEVAEEELPVGGESEGDVDSLDESFLDELDAELDKVAGEEEELGGSEMEQSSLDDLELDVSDEDLALMEEMSDSGDSANREPEETSLDEELGLEDTLGEDDSLGDVPEAGPEETAESAEDLEQQGVEEPLEAADLEDAEPESSDDDLDLPVASDQVSEGGRKPAVADIDESELGDDDDFDFLAGTDEAATKLDLARAYIEMGDVDGARDILEEVALEGNEDQKTEAQDLLKNLS